MMLGLRAIDPSTITVSSDPLAAFNAAQTSANNDAVLPLCAGMVLPAGFVGPVNCDSSQGGPTYSAATGQVATAQQQSCVQAGGWMDSVTGTCTPGASASTNTVLWVAVGLAVALTLLGSWQTTRGIGNER